MSIAVLDVAPMEADTPARIGHGVLSHVVEAGACVGRAAGTDVESLDDDELGAAVAELARVESRAAALRLALSSRRIGDR